MRVLLLLITAGIFISTQLQAQHKEKNDLLQPESREGTTIVCYSSGVDEHTFVPPPREVLRRMAARGQMTSTFEVSYNGFSQEAQDAFQFAVDIWSSIIISPVTIRIEANWVGLDPGTLGSASTTTFFRNFQNTPQFQVWYPIALAEKISGEQLNDPTEFEISANFNANNEWYFGTDLNPGIGEEDLVSVVLHEIAHGLGMIDTMDKTNGVGSYGLSGFPSIYDYYISTAHPDRLQLTDENNFDNPSTALGDEITSGNLFFNSPLAELPGNILPKVFAPAAFNPGSSIAHLDETTYRAGTPQSLMTPSIGSAEAIHSPGSLVLNMFAEMGWVHTYILHDPLDDTETFNTTFPISANVTSDSVLTAGSIELHYSLDSFLTAPTVVTMNDLGGDDYSFDIPNTGSPRTISYFITAGDNTGRTYSAPGEAPEFFYSFNAGPDTIKPVIEHQAIGFLLITEESVDLTAVVTDNFDLESVLLEYAINGVDQTPIAMTLDMDPEAEDDTYIVTLNFPSGSVAVGDMITYRIVATDDTSNNNIRTNPKDGFHEFSIDEISQVQASYENDFDATSTDFVGNNFSITTSSGFSNGAIQSDHPYLDGSGPNDESNYIYQLRIPIEVAASNSTIRFSEVVLIEPGEPGTVFGDQQFWDFAIVEGSLDDGTTWTPLLDGYDSRDDADWLSVYNGSIVGNNSTANGSSNLFKNRVIDLQDTYTTGDEVLIRFRLFADQAANGWGWAIDDLNIQGTIVTDIPDVFKLQEIKVYPNPTNGSLTVAGSNSRPGQQAQLKVYNTLGSQVAGHSWQNNAPEFSRQIDLSSLPQGIYTVKLQLDTEVNNYRIIKIN